MKACLYIFAHLFQKPSEDLLKVGSHQIIFPGHEEVPVKVEVGKKYPHPCSSMYRRYHTGTTGRTP
jgi:hypothetical protein